ncbi:MAG: lipoyl(octanoyl) transferase LipB [Syntrophotaleaceae bacterium]
MRGRNPAVLLLVAGCWLLVKHYFFCQHLHKGLTVSALYCHLGLLAYQAAHDLQTSLVQRRRRGELDQDLFLITEHPPVFTLGRRGTRNHLLVSEAFLSHEGIRVVPIERGGDITYHGPGQLVLYPIIDLRQAGLSATGYVTKLEELMLRIAADWNITANRDPRNRGIWVGDKKLGSVGIAIRHGIAFHGLALNVNPSLTPFGWINPCGLSGVEMTSIAKETGQEATLAKVLSRLIHHLKDIFNRDFKETTKEPFVLAVPEVP